MALEMTGAVVLPADPDQVYAALNDSEVLRACIPGCEELEKLSETELRAVATVKIGPVKARFRGRVTLSDLVPAKGYRITGEGDGGMTGFARGAAGVTLEAVADGTRLTYAVEAHVGGKLAQLGQRLLAGTAKKLADQFFANFVAAFAPVLEAAPQPDA